MRFYEYESKELFGRYGIPLPTGSKVVHSPAEAEAVAKEIKGPAVLKSQVLSGGRMKAGGVLFSDTPAQAAEAAKKILALTINGHEPRGVLVEQRAPVKQEYYLGITWDGFARKPVMICSDMGGIDIEEVAETHPDHIAKRHFSTLLPFSDYMAKELIAQLKIGGSDLNQLSRIASALARVFIAHGLTLAEINPLAKLEDGRFVCLDGHVDMEDDARDSQKAILKVLGIPPDEKRQARPPT
jgi:succinyl-CoA synthetase beta subunit